jgi:hypothetical protein
MIINFSSGEKPPSIHQRYPSIARTLFFSNIYLIHYRLPHQCLQLQLPTLRDRAS